MDIDYRPYTWESADKAKQIYNLACDYCSGIIGNDDEFAILSGSYDDGLNYAKNTKFLSALLFQFILSNF